LGLTRERWNGGKRGKEECLRARGLVWFVLLTREAGRSDGKLLRYLEGEKHRKEKRTLGRLAESDTALRVRSSAFTKKKRKKDGMILSGTDYHKVERKGGSPRLLLQLRKKKKDRKMERGKASW